MVYNDLDYLGKNDEEEGKEGEGQPVTPVASGQPNAGGVPAQSSPSQAPQQEARKGSGKFTNIKKYVDANQGGGQKLGEGIQKKIGSEADQVREGIQSAQGQFQKGAQQTNQTLNKATGYAQQVGQAGGAQQIADSQPEFQTFRDIYTGQVKGPEETISSQQNQAAKLNALSQLAGNEAGRFQLLDETYTNPANQYTRGQKRFDQLLLQATPDVTKNLQQFGETQAKDVQSKYSEAEKNQASEIQRLKDLGMTQQEALKTASGEYNQVTDEEGNTTYGSGALGNTYGELGKAQKAAKEKQTADTAAVRAALEKYGKTDSTNPQVGNLGKLTADQVAILGLDPSLRTYGLDMSRFSDSVREADTDITLADIANDEQKTRLNALYRLTGQDPTSINLGEKFGRQGAEIGESVDNAIQERRNELARNLDAQVRHNYKPYDVDITKNNTNIADVTSYGSFGGKDSWSKYYNGASGGTLPGATSTLTDVARTQLETALASGTDAEIDAARKSYSESLQNVFDVISKNLDRPDRGFGTVWDNAYDQRMQDYINAFYQGSRPDVQTNYNTKEADVYRNSFLDTLLGRLEEE